MVGIIGASNNPVSGMTIATMLFVTTIIKLTGGISQAYMTKCILIGGVVCVAIAVADGVAQSLKLPLLLAALQKKFK